MTRFNVLFPLVLLGLMGLSMAFLARGNKISEAEEGIGIGNLAPDLSYPSPEGDEISLSSLKGNLVLVDFWASWCGPCKAIAPIVEEIAAEYQGKIKVGKVNVDENPATPSNYGVRGIPTLILFKDGQVFDQVVGALPKSQLQSMLDKAL